MELFLRYCFKYNNINKSIFFNGWYLLAYVLLVRCFLITVPGDYRQGYRDCSPRLNLLDFSRGFHSLRQPRVPTLSSSNYLYFWSPSHLFLDWLSAKAEETLLSDCLTRAGERRNISIFFTGY